MELRLPEAGSGFEEAEYRAWWNALDPEDRVEFSVVNEGTEAHAKFIYLLDKWMISGGKWNRPDFSQIIEAYAIAFSCTAASARKHYNEALHHPSVETILARLTDRETFSAYTRIMHKRHCLTEKVLDRAVSAADDVDLASEDGEYALRLVNTAVKAAESLADSVSAARAEVHATRTKAAIERARTAALSTGVHREPSEDEIVVFFRFLDSKFGRERLDALLRASRQSSVGG